MNSKQQMQVEQVQNPEMRDMRARGMLSIQTIMTSQCTWQPHPTFLWHDSAITHMNICSIQKALPKGLITVILTLQKVDQSEKKSYAKKQKNRKRKMDPNNSLSLSVQGSFPLDVPHLVCGKYSQYYCSGSTGKGERATWPPLHSCGQGRQQTAVTTQDFHVIIG